MGKATGRKQKPGKRTSDGGRPSRAGLNPWDKGSEWVQSRKERFGDHYSTAIGRAFAAGLLADPSDAGLAMTRLQSAQKFAALYRRVIGGDSYRCPIDQSPRGASLVLDDDEQDQRDEEWLLINMGRIDATHCRPYFDQLTSRQFTDYGPEWLERLFDKPRDRRDTIVLDAAIRGIDAIGPVNTRVVIFRRVA